MRKHHHSYAVVKKEVEISADDILDDIPIEDVVDFHGENLLDHFSAEQLLGYVTKQEAMAHFGLVESIDEE